MTDALLEQSWAVQVPGTPVPQGSMTCKGSRGPRKHNIESANKKTLMPWRQQIEAGGRILPISGLTGPVTVEATFTIARPASHYRTGRNAHLLKDGAPRWPHQSHGSAGGNGDDDKFARAVLDGLADAGVYGNDIQVCHLNVWKCYPDTPGCPDRLAEPGAVIRVWPL